MKDPTQWATNGLVPIFPGHSRTGNVSTSIYGVHVYFRLESSDSATQVVVACCKMSLLLIRVTKVRGGAWWRTETDIKATKNKHAVIKTYAAPRERASHSVIEFLTLFYRSIKGDVKPSSGNLRQAWTRLLLRLHANFGDVRFSELVGLILTEYPL